MVRQKLKTQGREKGKRSKKDSKTRRTLEDAKAKKKLPNQRWTKGHSCVSNPENKKFREKASSQYFHHVIPNSLLTERQVFQNLGTEDITEEDLSADIQSLSVYDNASDGGSISGLSSIKTFATGWSKCTNNAFSRWLNKFKMDFYLHKEMLSILSATADVIVEAGGQQTETEYFATFISTLENCEPRQYLPLLSLLSIIMGKVSPGVLQIKFRDIYPKLENILTHAVESDDDALLCLVIGTLAKMLRVQDVKLLDTEKSVQNLAYSIMRCILHEKTKVRKTCRKAIKSILTAHMDKGSNIMGKFAISWVLDQLSCFPTCGPKSVCDTISFLLVVWDSIVQIPSSVVKKLFETVLRVMSSGDSSILRIGLAFYCTVFEKGWNFLCQNLGTLLPGLMTALWDMKPDCRNKEVFIGWLKCIMNGLVRSKDEKHPALYNYLPQLLQMISLNWHNASGREMSILVRDFFIYLVDKGTDKQILNNCCKVLSKNLIAVPPNPNCLLVLDGLLKAMSRNQFVDSCREIFLQLIPLKADKEVYRILETFVRTFGVEYLWEFVDEETRLNVIMPLLRDNLNETKIEFWKDNILTMSATTTEISVRMLVWDSLLGFCRNPVDPEQFPAEIVGKFIASNPSARLAALAALRQFIVWPQCKDIANKYSKNYLPILCNLYVQEREKTTEQSIQQKLLHLGNGQADGHADSVSSTIQEYLPLCEQSFVSDLMEKAMTKLKNEKSTGLSAPILDLISFLVPYNAEPHVQDKLLKMLSDLINDSANMKKAYRVLACLAKQKVNQDTKTSMVAMLRDNTGAKSNAASWRIKCMDNMITQDDGLKDEFLPEVVLNLLSINAKTKKVAEKFVSTYCTIHMDKKEPFDKVEKIVQLGINSTSPFVQASTIHFVGLAHIYLKPLHPLDSLIMKCLSLLETNKDQGVTRECLEFLALNLTMFKTRMGPYASSVGSTIANQKFPRKYVNKILVRMIKAFGVIGLKAVLPNPDTSNLQVRVKNLQKKLKKASEKKVTHKEKNEDSEESDDEIEERLFNNTDSSNLVIKEGLVDFLDPREITESFVNSKRKDPKEDEFKMSADGKLIIEDESDVKNRRKEDEDIDDGMSEPDFLTQKRKRKHGGSIASSASVYSKKSGKGSDTSRQPRKKSRKAVRKGKPKK